MRRAFTFQKGSVQHTASLAVIGTLLFSFMFFVSCYDWRTIIQPSTGEVNSYFDVFLVADDDGNPDNDWTNPDNHDIGLFGVLLPVGWTVQDGIEYQVICTEPGYDNNGMLYYDAAHSQTLQDSIPAPFGYYWWGAKSEQEVSLVFFDSLYLEPRIFTDDKTGTFNLRYAIGDVNYWDRNPADDVSDPIPITIVDYTGVQELLAGANVSVYPNPATEVVNIDFKSYRNQAVKMQLIDLTGKVVISDLIVSEQTRVDVSGLTEGIYFLTLSNGDDTSVEKIIVR